MIKINAQAKEVKLESGKTFLSWRGYDKKNNGIDIRFTSDVTVPKNAGSYTITINPESANISNKGRYPVLWIKEVISFEEGDTINREKQVKQLMDMFFEAE